MTETTPCPCGCGQDAATIERLTETLRRRSEALDRVALKVAVLADEWEEIAADEWAHEDTRFWSGVHAKRLREVLGGESDD